MRLNGCHEEEGLGWFLELQGAELRPRRRVRETAFLALEGRIVMQSCVFRIPCACLCLSTGFCDHLSTSRPYLFHLCIPSTSSVPDTVLGTCLSFLRLLITATNAHCVQNTFLALFLLALPVLCGVGVLYHPTLQPRELALREVKGCVRSQPGWGRGWL